MSRPVNTTPQVAHDVVTASLASRFLVTLGHPWRDFADGEAAPAGLHWCLAPEIVENDALAPDGIATGGIIPDLELPRRMWAGGEVHLLAPLRIGDRVERRSAVLDISRRQGRSGPLIFARIGHDYSVGGAVRVREAQTIVYRELSAPQEANAVPKQNAAGAVPEDWAVLRTVDTTASMLFRFSALTFNAHRIHYDREYATRVEGYPGLLVHGPLTASLMLDAGAAAFGPGHPSSVTIRALSPILCGSRLVISGRHGPDGFELRVHDGNAVAMTGTAAA